MMHSGWKTLISSKSSYDAKYCYFDGTKSFVRKLQFEELALNGVFYFLVL